MDIYVKQKALLLISLYQVGLGANMLPGGEVNEDSPRHSVVQVSFVQVADPGHFYTHKLYIVVK